MSISPPSDIVLDVMKAADPRRMREVTQRLKGMTATRAAAAGGAGAAWNKSLNLADLAAAGGVKPAMPTSAASSSALSFAASSAKAKSSASGAAAPGAAAPDKAAGQADSRMRKGMAALEGVVLENMLNGMLRDSGSRLFGKGLAGEYWKSMMAGAIASQVAKHGGMGLAEALVRRAGGPDGPAGAARALGMSQRLERNFLDRLDNETASGGQRVEKS